MADLIDKQQAIDAVRKALSEYNGEYDYRSRYGVIADSIVNLRILPSVEPERKDVFNRNIAIEAICDEVMLWFDISATKAYEIADTAVKRIEVRMEKMNGGEKDG